MAYKLKFRGLSTSELTAEWVSLASAIALTANTGTDNLKVEIEFELDSLAATNTLCFASNFCRFQILNTGQISVQYRNQTNSLDPVTSATGVISTGVRYVLALQLSNVDRVARIFLNDVEVGFAANRWGTFRIERLALWQGNSTFNGSIYRVTCYQNDTIVNNYDPSASSGAGVTLIDTAGGNNGTLVNFPTDDSQWVFYDDGPAIDDVSASIAVTMPRFSVSASAQASAPDFTANVSLAMPQFSIAASGQSTAPGIAASVAVTIPQLSVSASCSSVSPNYTASTSFLMPQFTASASASNTAPGIVASVSVIMPQLSVSAAGQQTLPDGGATVVFTMPQFTVSASSQQTVPDFSASIAAAMPQFAVNASVSAAEPGFVATVAYTMPQLSVAAHGETEAPNRAATVSVAMPQFSVSVIMADLVYGSAAGTRSELAVLSRKSELVALSRRSVYNKLSTRSEWRQ